MEDIKIKEYTISYYLYYYRVYLNLEDELLKIAYFDTLQEAIDYVLNLIKED